MTVYRMLAKTTAVHQAGKQPLSIGNPFRERRGNGRTGSKQGAAGRCMLNILGESLGNADNLISAAMNESTPQVAWENRLKLCSNFGYNYGGNAPGLLIGALALLYEQSELAKRFINILMIQVRTSVTANNSILTAYIFLETRKKWLNRHPVKACSFY